VLRGRQRLAISPFSLAFDSEQALVIPPVCVVRADLASSITPLHPPRLFVRGKHWKEIRGALVVSVRVVQEHSIAYAVVSQSLVASNDRHLAVRVVAEN